MAARPVLVIGQKCYSSWSCRPWLLLKMAGFDFEERSVDVEGRGLNAKHFAYSPSGLVPCLHLPSGQQVWDSLAIAEWLYEQPGHAAHVWPADATARAFARCIAAEMHSGFPDVRAQMPCNIKMRLEGRRPLAERVQQQVDRLCAIWRQARTQWGEPSGEGPYLFGRFSAADAMFAPVAFRFLTYNVLLSDPVAKAYCEALLANPHVRAWEAAALLETNAIAHYDAAALELGGAPRAKEAAGVLPSA